jgi:succinate dehydrogenase / fumarate reductase, iron-sulfur subunit
MGNSMQVTVRIQRFDPARDQQPHMETYVVDAQPTDRVLDVLHQIRWRQDGTLAFRRSCAHGVCGSDAMVINGKNRLACKVLIQDLKLPMTIMPIRGLDLIRDLTVDMGPFFKQYRKVMPYLITNSETPDAEHVQSQDVRERFDDTTKCILCAACTTSCPSFWAKNDYIGPAAIVQAHRFIFDDRDEGNAERYSVLNDINGVWRCRTTFNCVDACPRAIDVTKAIADVKKAIIRSQP